jgi:N-acetylglucosamine-6-phosphate deacetylase
MTGLHHREPGVVGAALTLPELTCELIADNVHVHPAAMRVLWQAKGADGVLLISDAVRGAGLPAGSTYLQDGRRVTIRDSAYLDDDTLAGSTLTLDAALRNFMRATGEPLERLWQTSSLNAARALGLADRKGSLHVGADADLVLLDADLAVRLTVVEGQIVYRV